jgi:hypothetical protein
MRTLLGLLLAAATLAAPPATAGCAAWVEDTDGDRACWRHDQPTGYLGALCGSGCPGGIDADGDRHPDGLEPFLCVVEDGGTPADGTCSNGDYRVPE